MKPFYSIQEIADLLNEDVSSVSNGLIASGVPAHFNGKRINLAEYDCFRPIGSGETIFVYLGGPPKPSPYTTIVSIEDLPESWLLSINPAAQNFRQEDHSIEPRNTAQNAFSPPQRQAVNGVDRNKILAAFPPPIGVTDKNWSKTIGKPPKWMQSGNARVFRGGPSVSSLWNPARFAMNYVEKDYMTKENATIVMRREFEAWLPEWENYIASFN